MSEDFVIAFEGSGDFESLRLAQDWCSANGYSYGTLERGAPIGILCGDFDISKWRNMTAAERNALDGTMFTPDLSYRSGPVTIRIKGRV